MRLTFTLFALAVYQFTFSQTFKEKELKTEIKEVTVFLNAAQIFESGTAVLAPGKWTLRINNLSPHMDEKSIQVKAQGDFTILSVNHRFNYLSELKKDDVIDSLRKLVEGIEADIIRENAKLEVLAEKYSILSQNKNFGGQSGTNIDQLKQAIILYETEVSKIKQEEIRSKKYIELRKKEQFRLERELKEINEQYSLPTSEIEIRVSTEKQETANLRITYLVANAGWYPKYDIRVHTISKPLELVYKAEVFQNTGVDWKNVKLRFSNGDPKQSGVIPELTKWNLNFARNTIFENSVYDVAVAPVRTVRGKILDEEGQPLPGVNIVVKGTTIGTVTDAAGNYSITLPNGAKTMVASFIGLQAKEIPITQSDIDVHMQQDVTQLNEVVVTGYGARLQGRMPGLQIRGNNSVRKVKTYAPTILKTNVIENQTTVEFEVEMPYSIKSNGEKLLVDLKRHDIDAAYQYYAVPKLDKDAFLVARIVNWDQYNLLEGEANLYFEDGFVGRTVLDAKSLKDTLNISLGRDRNIVIGREMVSEFCKKKTIGSNLIETRGFKITVRNKKSHPVNLLLYDQIPVAIISDITVEPLELSGGELEQVDGKVKWQLEIKPQQQKEIALRYEVRYPRREKIYLE
jgi:hypothetical protein